MIGPLAGAALLASAGCGVLPPGLDEQPNGLGETALKAAEILPSLPQDKPGPRSGYAVPLPRFKPTGIAIVVGDGDTVYAIARRYGVLPKTLIELNGLDHPYWLLKGQRLRLPRGIMERERPVPAPQVVPRRTAATDISVEVLPPPTAAPVPGAVMDERSVELSLPAAQDARDTRRTDAALTAPAVPLASARPDAMAAPPPLAAGSFLWPVHGRVISVFGPKPGGMHNDGINIEAPVGSAVRAAQSGVVAYVGNELSGYGNLVLIRHASRWMTAYAHNDALRVETGDMVERGQVISLSGMTGRVSRPQVHFEIRLDDVPQDPLDLLARERE